MLDPGHQTNRRILHRRQRLEAADRGRAQIEDLKVGKRPSGIDADSNRPRACRYPQWRSVRCSLEHTADLEPAVKCPRRSPNRQSIGNSWNVSTDFPDALRRRRVKAFDIVVRATP